MAQVVTGQAAVPTSFDWLPAGSTPSQFNRTFPKVFPRFVQLAIWRYCSEKALDICNGNRRR